MGSHGIGIAAAMRPAANFREVVILCRRVYYRTAEFRTDLPSMSLKLLGNK